VQKPIAGYERETFSAGCTMNIGLKKLLREVASTFCGAHLPLAQPTGSDCRLLRPSMAPVAEVSCRLPVSDGGINAPNCGVHRSPIVRPVHRAAVYITFVEHPARMQCGVELAATEFAPSYRRATVMQASCAGLGLLSSLAAWLGGASFWWGVAGVFLGSVIPFTLIVILPTNKQLLSPALDRRSAEAVRLLASWGRLHAVRSILSGIALLLFLYLAVFKNAG
jgi:hypothetical protein